MQIDTEHLKSLLERATPGPWRVESDDYGEEIIFTDYDERKNIAQGRCCDEDIEVVSATSYTNEHDVKLIALAPALARRVIAAEKLAEAVRAYRDRTSLSYSEINVARLERSIELAKAVDQALSEWDKSQ